MFLPSDPDLSICNWSQMVEKSHRDPTKLRKGKHIIFTIVYCTLYSVHNYFIQIKTSFKKGSGSAYSQGTDPNPHCQRSGFVSAISRCSDPEHGLEHKGRRYLAASRSATLTWGLS